MEAGHRTAEERQSTRAENRTEASLTIANGWQSASDGAGQRLPQLPLEVAEFFPQRPQLGFIDKEFGLGRVITALDGATQM